MRNHDDEKDYVTSGFRNEAGIDAPESNTAFNAAGIEGMPGIEGSVLLDRIQARLSSCNVGAGYNFVDVLDLRDAFALIEMCKGAVVAGDVSRHTAISCRHTVAQVRDKVEQLIMGCATDDRLMLISKITAACVSLMWDHADEIRAQYTQIISKLNGR